MERLVDEICCSCESEVLVTEFGPRICPGCGKEIVSCGDCSEDCGVEKEGGSGR